MNNILNLIRLVFVGGFLILVLFNSRKNPSPQQNRRLFGLGGILISFSYLMGFIVQDAFLASAQIFLWLAPAVGGLLLIVVSYISRWQGSFFEYVAWTLVSTWVIAFTYVFEPSIWVQWGLAIFTAIVGFIVQFAEKKPASELL